MKILKSALCLLLLYAIIGSCGYVFASQTAYIEQIAVYDVVNGIKEAVPEVYSGTALNDGSLSIAQSQQIEITAKIPVANKDITVMVYKSGQDFMKSDSPVWLYQQTGDAEGRTTFELPLGVFPETETENSYEIMVGGGNAQNAFSVISVKKADRPVYVIDELDFEECKDNVIQNTSKTIGMFSHVDKIKVQADGDNKVGAIITPSETLSSGWQGVYQSGEIYFEIPDDAQSYQIGWSFKFLNGNGVLFKALPDTDMLGEICIYPDGNVVAGGNWSYAEDSNSTKVPCAANQWHRAEIHYSGKTGKWYLDGLLINTFTVATDKKPNVFQIFAAGTAQMFENESPVLYVDDISSSVTDGNFKASLLAKDNKLTLNFSETPAGFDMNSITAVTDRNGNVISLTNPVQTGKRYVYTMGKTAEQGKRYYMELPAELKSIAGNSLMNSVVVLACEPDVGNIKITPDVTGGIFTDRNSVNFTVSVDRILDGKAVVTAEDGTVLWDEELSFNSQTDINPCWIGDEYRYGRFWIEVFVKQTDSEVYKTEKIPFSVVYSNGVLNPNVGVNTHYASNLFSTDINNLDAEMNLNTLAGFGVMRENFGWNAYQTSPNNYGFTEMQAKLLSKATEQGVSSMLMLYNATWRHLFDEEGSPVLMDMPITPTELGYYSTYLSHLVSDMGKNGYTPLYEVSNEWDLTFRNKTSSNVSTSEVLTVKKHYLPMVSTAYQAIKTVNANARVIGISASLNYDMLEYIKECIDAGVLNYCDAIAIHPYSDPITASPEEYATVKKLDSSGKATGESVTGINDLINEIKAMLQSTNKPDMPIILSEWGWTTAPGLVTEEEQAAYSVRGLGLVCDKVESTVFYVAQNKKRIANTLERNFGLLEANDSADRTDYPIVEEPISPLAAKPSYIALSFYNSITGDKIPEALKSDNKNYSRTYSNNEETVIQFWNYGGTGAYSVLASELGTESAMLYDMYGNCKPVSAQNGEFLLTASKNPQYIIAKTGLDIQRAVITANGKEFTDFADVPVGTEIQFETAFSNNSTDKNVLDLIISAYNGNRLVSCNSERITVSAGESGESVLIPKIIKTADTTSCKAYIWKNGFEPICDEIIK